MAKYFKSVTDLKLANITIDCDVMKFLFERSKRLEISDLEFVGDASILFRNCSKLKYL